jgi:tetratricopeptide (TPR) repeat protein
MALEPPQPPRSERPFSAAPPKSPFAPGPTSESIALDSLQSQLEDARGRYALRDYKEVGRILPELEKSVKTLLPANLSGELAIERDFLMASICCLRGRLLYETPSTREKSAADFMEAAHLFEKHKSELGRHRAGTHISTDYGIALVRLRRVPEAVKLLQRICKGGTAPADAFRYLGFIYQQSGRLQKAEDAYRKGLQLVPGDPLLLQHLAETLTKAKRFNEAVRISCLAAVAALRIDDLKSAQELALRALELAPTDAQALTIAVNVQVARNDRVGAMATVAGVLEQDPQHAWALGLKGQLLRLAGELDEAIKTLRAVDVQTLELVWVLVELAGTLHEQGAEHDAEALELLKRASQLNPQDEAALSVQARILLDNGEIAKAVTALERAVEIDPHSASLQCELGRAFLLSDDPDDVVRAREAYDAALRLDPRSTLALAGKGDVLRKEKDFAQALDLYRRVLRREPDNEGVFRAMVDVQVAQDRIDEALEDLDEEIERRPKAAWPQWYKGRVLRYRKDLNGAALAFGRAFELLPDNPTVVGDLADTLRRMDDVALYEKAGEVYDHLLQLLPESPYALAGKALYLSDIASFQEASDLVDRAIKITPEEAWFWSHRGWCLENLGPTFMAQAREAYERALSMKKEGEDDLWERKGLANTLCQLGHEDEARTHFEEITDQQKYKTGNDALILAALGWCHYRLGRYDEAVRLLRASLSVDEDPAAQFDLGLVLLASSRSSLALSEYQRAADLAKRKHVLRQRGLYYVALFDLVEAAKNQSFEGDEADNIFKLLRSHLHNSGVDLSALSWLPDQLPRKPSANVR